MEQANDSSIDFGCEQIGEVPVPTMEDMGISLPIADRITRRARPLCDLRLRLPRAAAHGQLRRRRVLHRCPRQLAHLQAAARPRRPERLPRRASAARWLPRSASACSSSARGWSPRSTGRTRPAAPDATTAGGLVAQLLLRAVLVVVAAGLLGAALALLPRHTAGLVGLLLGYLVVVEFIAVQAFLGGRLTPWPSRPTPTPSSPRATSTWPRRAPPSTGTGRALSACRKSATRTAGSTCSCSCSASRRQQSSSSDVATSPDLPLQPPHAIQPYAAGLVPRPAARGWLAGKPAQRHTDWLLDWPSAAAAVTRQPGNPVPPTKEPP